MDLVADIWTKAVLDPRGLQAIQATVAVGKRDGDRREEIPKEATTAVMATDTDWISMGLLVRSQYVRIDLHTISRSKHNDLSDKSTSSHL